ncbi:glycosyl transferase [Leptolyngbya sp. 'hensonii']|uniref:glycosyltransferase family 2 protein n=1 Tax=Leptolyngbya sp. 'hensonii' TaxID=1922337 RepID=UPI000950333E|nr:glycosyltransferase family 2 protein [Leptolyngbya sp. 'hensonii']OLP18689.1 glycosyl transferase [Leptolyngbya sp. 'hensonii']
MNSSNLDSILVIIPVLNEEATIAQVIQSLQLIGLYHIRVVDNGSQDRSADVAFKAGAEVLHEPLPGYGRACWRGLQAMPESIQWILFCDGDGSDDVSALNHFFSFCAVSLERQNQRYDLILGDRTATAMGRSALTPVQRFGNGLATTLIWFGWGYRYRDLGPLRLIRRSALEQIQMRDRGFGWTVEMQVRAIEGGLRICELPVNYHCRQGGRSKISGTIRGSIRAGIVILATLGRLYGRRWLQKINGGSVIRC